MLLSVWVLFIVTWSPYLILNCILSYWLSLGLDVDGKEGTILIQTFGLLTMANSSMNPLLYAFMSKLVDYMSTLYISLCTCLENNIYLHACFRQFRRGFVRAFACIPCVARRIQAEATSVYTRSTHVDPPPRKKALPTLSEKVENGEGGGGVKENGGGEMGNGV